MQLHTRFSSTCKLFLVVNIILLLFASKSFAQKPKKIEIRQYWLFESLKPKSYNYYNPWAYNTKYDSGGRLLVNTNLAYLALGVANLGVDFITKANQSVGVEMFYSPYKLSETFFLQAMGASLSYNLWLGGEAYRGFYVNLHGLMSIENMAFNTELRSQGVLYACGIGAGYAIPLSKSERWYLKLGAGAGYLYHAYETYQNEPSGALYESDLRDTMFSLTQLELKIAYRL